MGKEKKTASIQVINEDCLNFIGKFSDLANNQKFVLITDPPFNINYHYNEYKDNMGEEDYYSMLCKVFSDNPFICIHYPEHLYKLSIHLKRFPNKVVSWVYNSNTAKQHRDIAFFDIKPNFAQYPQPYKNPKDKRIAKRIEEGKSAKLYDWWEVNQVKNVSKEKTEHPCQMPIEVMKRIVSIIPKDLVVIDPFAGSGTTGLACQDVGIDCILIEKDSLYCDIIKKRLLV